MTIRPTNIFNAVGAASQEEMRELLYHALAGDGVVDTAVGPEGNDAKARAAREEEDREFQQWVQFALASEERIERFHEEMEAMEDKRLKLLERTEDELREAREKLQRLRDAAPEITMPDGTRRKVFRDGDAVRDESGAVVGADIITAQNVSDDPNNWKENVDLCATLKRLETREQRLERIGDEIKNAERRADNGKMSDKDMNDFDAALDKALTDEEERAGLEPDPHGSVKEKTFDTNVTPDADFARVVAGTKPESPNYGPDDGFKLPGPTASTPAPK